MLKRATKLLAVALTVTAVSLTGCGKRDKNEPVEKKEANVSVEQDCEIKESSIEEESEIEERESEIEERESEIEERECEIGEGECEIGEGECEIGEGESESEETENKNEETIEVETSESEIATDSIEEESEITTDSPEAIREREKLERDASDEIIRINAEKLSKELGITYYSAECCAEVLNELKFGLIEKTSARLLEKDGYSLIVENSEEELLKIVFNNEDEVELVINQSKEKVYER